MTFHLNIVIVYANINIVANEINNNAVDSNDKNNDPSEFCENIINRCDYY